jgi:hypothetical protein
MSRNARVTDSYYGVLPAEALDCTATAAGAPFVAGLIGVIEVWASRPLKKVASCSCAVSELA